MFEGDGYSDEWKEEARKRGLNDLESTPDALPVYTRPSTVSLFEENNILTERELNAHQEVMLENYSLNLQIESRALGEMIYNQILPAALKYQTAVAENFKSLTEMGIDGEQLTAQRDILERLNNCIQKVAREVKEMTEKRRSANRIGDPKLRAEAYCREIKPLLNSIRICSDRLEYLIDDKEWPLAKYRELMFIK